MDNLVLIRVAQVLDAGLRRAVLRELRGEGSHAYRLVFEAGDRRRSLLVSLRPELPWIGRPAGRWKAAGRRVDRFSTLCRDVLAGAVLESFDKPTADRVVHLRFSSGRILVAELATHGANLVLLEPGGNILVSARHPRTARHRLTPGEPYRPPRIPRRLLVPFGLRPEEIDTFVQDLVARGESPLEALRKHVFGVGSEAADQVVRESLVTGRSGGEVLSSRLRALEAGQLDPVVLASSDPFDLAEVGRVPEEGLRLLPWAPPDEETARGCWRGRDAAVTAGVFHGSVERAAEIASRFDGLRGILRKEVRRLWDQEGRIADDLRSFRDPERYRIWGEALLAGLRAAERIGETVRVPDPYDPARQLSVPAPPGRPLTAVADGHFRRHRRAHRGQERARRRAAQVRARRERLETLVARSEDLRGADGIEALEAAMRAERIPVGLARRGRTRAAEPGRVRLEGVRIFTSTDGMEILVGRTGRDNDRLTFRLASPEDFWLHALGRPGAHVVIRNPQRLSRAPRSTLVEAAVLAAWYSGARGEAHVEVQFTRRRNVRRLRDAPPGTVTVKRWETVRVRPTRPREGLEEER